MKRLAITFVAILALASVASAQKKTPSPSPSPSPSGSPSPKKGKATPSPTPAPSGPVKQAETRPSDDPAATVLVVDRQSKDSLEGNLRYYLEAMYQAKPSLDKIRLTLIQVYNPSTNETFRHLQSIVPLDANENPDGVEEFRKPFDNTPIRTVEWKAGLKDGVEKVYEPGRRDYYVQKEVPWKAGKIEGAEKTYYPNGKVKSTVTYVNNLAEGDSITYDEDGKMNRKAVMTGGKRGPITDYWPSGTVKRTLPFDHAKLNGTMQEFSESGKIQHEQAYKDNKKHGLEKTYDADGKLTATLYWVNDESVAKGVYDEKYKP